MKVRFLAALLPLFVAPTDAQALSNGRIGDLLGDCKTAIGVVDNGARITLDAGLCIGYINGTAETLRAWRTLDSTVSVCIPDSANANQLIRVFIKWADLHPERHHQARLIGVMLSLREAFPCS